MHNSEGKLPGEHHVSWIGPLQLAIHVVQNRHAGEQKTHWGKQTKGIYTFKINGNFLCLSCPSTTFALKCFGLVPREWLDAKGLLGKQNIQAKKVFRVESPAEKKLWSFSPTLCHWFHLQTRILLANCRVDMSTRHLLREGHLEIMLIPTLFLLFLSTTCTVGLIKCKFMGGWIFMTIETFQNSMYLKQHTKLCFQVKQSGTST